MEVNFSRIHRNLERHIIKAEDLVCIRDSTHFSPEGYTFSFMQWMPTASDGTPTDLPRPWSWARAFGHDYQEGGHAWRKMNGTGYRGR